MNKRLLHSAEPTQSYLKYVKLFFRLRQIDLEVMRRLHGKVNIVPVVAKADTLTAAEIKKLKQRILQDIEENQIQVRQFSSLLGRLSS